MHARTYTIEEQVAVSSDARGEKAESIYLLTWKEVFWSVEDKFFLLQC